MRPPGQPKVLEQGLADAEARQRAPKQAGVADAACVSGLEICAVRGMRGRYGNTD